MRVKLSIQFNNGFISEGDTVSVWIDRIQIIGEVTELNNKSLKIGRCYNCDFWDIKEIAKKTDGQWTLMEIKR